VDVLAPPPQDEPEALFREARARQRRRKVVAAATVAVVAAGVFAVYAAVEGGSSATRPRRAFPIAPPQTCRSSQLRLSASGDGAATGRSFLNFAFTNASPSACVLQGRARMGVMLQGGRRVALRALHIPNQLMYDKPPKCLRLRAVLVTPPGSRVALQIDRPPFEFCGQRFEGFTPLVPGRIDRYMA
jgi:hypothetical protein